MTCLLMRIVAMIAVSSCGLAGESADRHVEIAVEVVDANGKPVEAVPVVAGMSTSGMWATTNEHGKCVLAGEVADQCVLMHVKLTAASTVESLRDRKVHAQRYEQVVKDGAYRAYYNITLRPGEEKYSLRIQGEEAVTVSGRVLDSAGRAARALVVGQDVPELTTSAEDSGAWSLDGIRKLQPCKVYAISMASGKVKERVGLLSELAQGGHLGDIVMPDMRGVPVQVQVTNIERMPWMPINRAAMVTMVRMDGEAWIFPVGRDGKLVMAVGSRMDPAVPPGTYFVVAGCLGPCRASQQLLEAVQQHKVIELEKVGVPKVVVTEDGGSLVFDGAAAETAVYSLGGER